MRSIAVMKDFGLSHTKLQLFTEALRKVKTPGLEFLFKRNILTQDQFMTLHGGLGLGKVEILKIVLKGFPRYDLLLNLYKIARGVQKFDRLFEKYPSSPQGFSEWENEFLSIMNDIRN